MSHAGCITSGVSLTRWPLDVGEFLLHVPWMLVAALC